MEKSAEMMACLLKQFVESRWSTLVQESHGREYFLQNERENKTDSSELFKVCWIILRDWNAKHDCVVPWIKKQQYEINEEDYADMPNLKQGLPRIKLVVRHWNKNCQGQFQR